MVRFASDWRRCPFRAFVLVLILLLQSIAPALAATADNGNPTTYRGRTNTYDLPGRMATMRDGNNWSVGYTYGADGLIASRAKTIYVWMFGAWTPVTSTPTYFINDGGEPVFELAQDMSEDPASTYSVSNITVRGPDGLVARKQGSSWIYYEFDQQGNVSQRRNSSGGLLTSSIYDAYGAETDNGGTPTDPFGYNAQWGYWLDRDTGLYLCQHRWYDPVTARWVTRDPIGYSGGANLYGYCGGSGVGVVDASGARPLNSVDHQRIEKIANYPVGSGATRSMLEGATLDLALEILMVRGSDPPRLKAIFFAIDQLGNDVWGYTTTPKCNAFVALAYARDDGAGVGFFGAQGFPYRKGRTGPGFLSANTLSDPAAHFANLPQSSTGRVGDILAFESQGGGGHATLKLGGGLLIYAGHDDAKIGSYSYVNDRDGGINRHLRKLWRLYDYEGSGYR